MRIPSESPRSFDPNPQSTPDPAGAAKSKISAPSDASNPAPGSPHKLMPEHASSQRLSSFKARAKGATRDWEGSVRANFLAGKLADLSPSGGNPLPPDPTGGVPALPGAGVGHLDVLRDGRSERDHTGEADRLAPEWWARVVGYVTTKAIYESAFGGLAGLAGLVITVLPIPTDSPYTEQDARRDREMRRARDWWEGRHGVPYWRSPGERWPDGMPADGILRPREEDLLRWYRQRDEPTRPGGNDRPPVMGGATGNGHGFNSWGSSTHSGRRQRERPGSSRTLGVWSGRGDPQHPTIAGGSQTPNAPPPSGGGGGGGGGTMQPSQSSHPHDSRPTDRSDHQSSSGSSDHSTNDDSVAEVKKPDSSKPDPKKAVGLAPDPSTGESSGRGGNDLGARVPESSPDNRSHLEQMRQPAVRLVLTGTGAADEEKPQTGHPQSDTGGGASSDDLGDDLRRGFPRAGGGISTPFAPRFREHDPAGPEGGSDGH